MIKAIIFDLDDTLYSYNELNEQGINEICNYTCEKLRIEKEKFYEAFDKAKKDVKDTLGDVASSHNRLLYCQKTLENLKRNPFSIALEMYEIYWQHILKNMKLNVNALEILKFCKQKKIKIGICTDFMGKILYDVNAQPNIFSKEFFSSWENPPKDFALDLYALYMAKKNKLKVIRFNVLFPERIHGQSTWNTGLASKWKFIKRTMLFSLELKKRGVK